MLRLILGMIIFLAVTSAIGQALPDSQFTTFHLLPTRHMRLFDEATNPQTTVARLRTLLEDTDLEVRSASARILGTRGELEDVPLLEHAAQTAPPSIALTAAVRIAVARLQTLGEPVEKQIAALLPFLQEQPLAVSLEAVLFLSELHHEDAVSGLSSFALRQATDARSLAKVLPYLPTTLDARFKDKLPQLELAIQSYLPFVDYFGREPPAEHITLEENIACEIAYWRIRFSGMKPEEKIKLVAQDPVAEKIGGLIDGLLADEDQLPQLLPLLNRLILNKTVNYGRRRTIVNALAEQGYQPAADNFLRIIRDTQESERLRASALTAMTDNLKDPRVLGLAVEILRQYREQKESPVVARRAINAIVQFGLIDGMVKADIEPLVLPYLKEQWPFPLVAIEALGVVGTSQSLPQLLEIATNGFENMPPDVFQKDSIRWDAMKALGHIGDKQAEPLLLSQLDNKNANYRIQAIQALTFMNSGLAIPRIANIVRNDKDELTVRYAVSSLCQLQGKAISPFFTELLGGVVSATRKELLTEALLNINPEVEIN